MPLSKSINAALPYLALLLLGWLALAPGIVSLPPIDRDESRYAQASKQMLETGDFVRIRFQSEPRNKKPAGVYWLEAASAWATGEFPGSEIWPYRLPSLLAALAALLLTYGFGRRLFDAATAIMAAGFLGGSVLLAVVARQAHTDACLLAAAIAAEGALGLLYLARRRSEPARLGPALVFWAAEGAAILIKGPVVPAIGLLTILALTIADRDWGWWRDLRAAIGVPLALLIAGPWFIAVSRATDGGFIADAVSSDLLPKLLGGQEGHGAPPGYYLVMMLLAFWPGSLFAWPALALAWRERFDPAIRFTLAWLVPAWLMFELVPTKLPSYVLPAYPALALLTAHLLRRAATGLARPLQRGWSIAIGGIWLLLSLALALAPVAIGIWLHGAIDWVALGLAALGGAIAGSVAVLARRRRWQLAAAVAAIGSALLMAGDFGVVLPREHALWTSQAAAAAIRLNNRSPEGAAAVVSTGYNEPSLVFLVGTRLGFVDPETAAAHLASAADHLALVRDREDAAFRRAAAAAGTSYRVLDSIKGFNYSRGQWVNLTLYGRTP